MGTVEKFMLGSLSLIALYLVLSKDSGSVIRSIASGASGIFKTLQGRG